MRLTRLEPEAFAENPFSIEEWTAALHEFIGPLMRHPMNWTPIDRDILSAELTLLARVWTDESFLNLLDDLLAVMRRGIDASPWAHARLRERLPLMYEAASRWLDSYDALVDLGENASQYAQVDQAMRAIDAILEGSVKRLLVIVLELAEHGRTAAEVDLTVVNLGGLVRIVREYGGALSLIAGEPRTAISLNQWRNIAAHRSFRCIGPELVEVSFGAGPEPYVRVLTIEDVSETMDWAMKLHSVLKLAVDLLIIDEAEHLHGVGGPPPAVRVDGWLVQIRHSLALQGYRGAAWGVAGDTIGLDLVDTRADRDLQTAIIHSSQVLDQLAYAALRDPIYAGQVKWAVVRIVSDDGKTRARAGARVTVHDAIECVEGRLDMTGLLHRTEFAFAPAEVLAGWLPRGLPVRRYTATRSC